jgi:zinc/manganese transport system permease protein
VSPAYLAGTGVALAAGLVGYFLVLRAQVFTADALSHVAFTGALAALAAGFDARLGLFTVTVLVALGMGTIGPRARPDDVVIGGLFAWILGLGVLFLSLFTRTRSDGSAVAVLFGSILGVSPARAVVSAAISTGVGLAVLALARPLLFASVDPDVARARGVPVRALGLAFLALVGITVAEASQVVGALLILGLLAAPAGAASRLTDRPVVGLGLSAGIAVASVWVGLAVADTVPSVPPSFAILAAASLAFVAASVRRRLQRMRLARQMWRAARRRGRLRSEGQRMVGAGLD